MIVSIGEAYIKDNAVCGTAVANCLRISALGGSAMFAGAVSSDADGIRVLEYLIDNCILFEPSFCNDAKPTCVEGPEGIAVQDSCIFSIDAQRLKEALRLNTDARIVLPNSIAFTSEKVRNAVWEAVSDRALAVCLDLTAQKLEEETQKQWASRSEIVIADENTARRIRPFCKNILVEAAPHFSGAAEVCTIYDGALEKGEDAAAALLKNTFNDCRILTCLP